MKLRMVILFLLLVQNGYADWSSRLIGRSGDREFSNLNETQILKAVTLKAYSGRIQLEGRVQDGGARELADFLHGLNLPVPLYVVDERDVMFISPEDQVGRLKEVLDGLHQYEPMEPAEILTRMKEAADTQLANLAFVREVGGNDVLVFFEFPKGRPPVVSRSGNIGVFEVNARERARLAEAEYNLGELEVRPDYLGSLSQAEKRMMPAKYFPGSLGMCAGGGAGIPVTTGGIVTSASQADSCQFSNSDDASGVASVNHPPLGEDPSDRPKSLSGSGELW